MATNLCFYFQVHQPWRLRHYRFLEVGRSQAYFDDDRNSSILRRVADKCYLPMNNLLLDLIAEYKGEFKVAFSISAVVLQQMDAYTPEVVASFRRLFETGKVELLSETSHHSLASLYSPQEFQEEVALHREVTANLLIPPSKVFRNTELIASNGIARMVEDMGYEAMIMEGADSVLRWRSPLFNYRMAGTQRLVALLKNYRLSDDIAFRFSDRQWAQWPLTAEKFAEWIRLVDIENPVASRGGIPFLGLFMDYETFGEHQWAETGIFDFFRALPGKLLKAGNVRFITPSEALAAASKNWAALSEIDAPEPFSWADIERDLSAWRGNPIQDSALRTVYRLEKAVRARGDDGMLETWRRLLTSDHFYYMCTKYFSDGDVHKYFNPYDSPYDAHIIYMNVLADMAARLGVKEKAIA